MNKIAVCCCAVALAISVPAACRADAAKWDPRMANVQAAVDTNGFKWIDGRFLPLEGRAFDDTARFYDRLPANVTTNVNGGVRSLKRHTSGMSFRFVTDARRVVFKWTLLNPAASSRNMGAIGSSGIDVYVRRRGGEWKYLRTGAPDATGKGGMLSVGWVPGEECLVYLPLYNGIETFALGVTEGAKILPPPPHKGVQKPVVFYGTSITHGGCASRPGLSFVNIIGRSHDWPVVNLGFSGSGRMELEMADHLARIDASCYVLDCLWNMNETVVMERYEPFVRKLRSLRPDVPIVMAGQCDVFCGKPNAKELHAKAVCDRLAAEGWKGLVFLPKDKMFNGDREGTVDGCHPNDRGMATMAEAFGDAVRRALSIERN